jgi:hypothetical protein
LEAVPSGVGGIFFKLKKGIFIPNQDRPIGVVSMTHMDVGPFSDVDQGWASPIWPNNRGL